jgi:hypothetical protein
MQYLIGSILGMVAIILCLKLVNTKQNVKTVSVDISQSKIYEVIKPAIPILEILERLKPKETQASKYEKSLLVRVMVVEGEAYWIKDSVVYQAHLDQEENIDKESTKVVDIINMDDIQLKKIMFIIDKLTEGLDDDSSNTGNTIL